MDNPLAFAYITYFSSFAAATELRTSKYLLGVETSVTVKTGKIKCQTRSQKEKKPLDEALVEVNPPKGKISS